MTSPAESAAPIPAPATPQHLHGWRHPAILAAAALSVASGYAQFGVFTALADVAERFGMATGTGTAGEIGLSGTALGIGLGVIRLAALGALPLSSMADHVGRRRVLLGSCGLGLAITALAAIAPAYWIFIALFALGRPLLSATNAIAGVIAAEETRVKDRTKAIGLITAAYGLGAGLPALVRALDARVLGGVLGFRGLFGLTIVPLVLLPFLARRVEEPDRFARVVAGGGNRLTLGAIEPALRARLALICCLAFTATFAATPINGYMFLYAEDVLGISPTFTFVMVVAAGVLGLLGLLAGRWAADVIGRRLTCATMHVVAGVAGILAYRGGLGLAVGGYLIGLAAASAFAPAVGAMSAEIFPTGERATAAGWLTAASALGAVGGLVAFGVLSDQLGGFSSAALAVSLPVVLTAPLYWFIPETRGLELEESAPERV